jgi:hypothetical protein
VRQKDAQEDRRTNGNLLEHQHSLPNHFGGRVETNRGRHCLSRCVSREEPTDGEKPSPCAWLRSRRDRAHARK